MIDRIKENFLFFRLRRKDKKAFEEFYDLYVDRIYQYIFYKVGDRAEAEDLTSEFFLKIWNFFQEGKIEDHKTLKPLIYTIARNMVIDHYRQKERKKTESLDAERSDEEGGATSAAENLADKGESQEERIDRELDSEYIKSKLFELKDEYREIIILKYFDGLSAGEIAKAMGKSKGNARVLSYRAIQALKNIVEKDRGNLKK